MPVIVIAEDTDLPGLTARLLRSNASAGTRDAAARALRAANPGVDLGRLRAGAVVVVPDLHAGLAQPAGSVDPGLRAAADRVATQVGGLDAVIGDGARVAAEGRERARAALEDRSVRAALKGDDAAKAVARRLTEHLGAAEERAAEQAELVQGAMAAWSEDLKALRDVLPDQP